MRVGVYVDGFNLYYGGRQLFGRTAGGWRWLDIRGLVTSLVVRRRDWTGAAPHRVVYCTARVDWEADPPGHRAQGVYLKALAYSGSVDHIEFGHFVSRVKTHPLATADCLGRPVLATSRWPVMVQDSAAAAVRDARFMVSHASWEEKGSDVNVATHLLIDPLGRSIDGAVVISNDSDLRLPIQEARRHIPVGTVNPGRGYLAGDLRGDRAEGAGRHWWAQLCAADYLDHQLADKCGAYARPEGW